MMKGLQPPDLHHLNAAEGWLGLGNTAEATLELARLSPAVINHPEVLRVRYQLHEKGRQWDRAAEVAQILCQAVPQAPFGWIHLAFALHELRRTREAYDVLVTVADKFPDEYVIPYNLACYSCQLGELVEARGWLKKAMAMAGNDAIKEMGSDDRDLEALWKEIKNA
jgi:predicted Zn-dependent protease